MSENLNQNLKEISINNESLNVKLGFWKNQIFNLNYFIENNLKSFILITFPFILVILPIIFYSYYFSKYNLYAFINIYIIIISIISLGVLIGFIFGIPKFEKNSNNNKNSKNSNLFIFNTSLSDISDWIVKLIIGGTLIQFSSILFNLKYYSNSISNKYKINNVNIFSEDFVYAIIIFCFIYGFITAYLITNFKLPFILESIYKKSSNKYSSNEYLHYIRSLEKENLEFKKIIEELTENQIKLNKLVDEFESTNQIDNTIESINDRQSFGDNINLNDDSNIENKNEINQSIIFKNQSDNLKDLSSNVNPLSTNLSYIFPHELIEKIRNDQKELINNIFKNTFIPKFDSIIIQEAINSLKDSLYKGIPDLVNSQNINYKNAKILYEKLSLNQQKFLLNFYKGKFVISEILGYNDYSILQSLIKLRIIETEVEDFNSYGTEFYIYNTELSDYIDYLNKIDNEENYNEDF